MTLDLDSTLNKRQAEAVRHTQGPLLVLAGAGSGKTRVITYKIAHLVLDQGLKPWQILAVTFTNKAAAEMRERSEALLGPEAREVWLGTFHSIGLRVLRRHADLVERTRNFVIYDEDDRERLIKRVMRDMNISKDVLNARKVRYYVDDQKHLLRGPDHAELPVVGYIDALCAKVYKGYEAAKKNADAFDFSDLIFRFVHLLKKHEPVLSEWRYRWRYIMVDEFQDTDHAQYELLRMLAGDKANLCVVGDDDQSIYRWRGADVSNILEYPTHFPDHKVMSVRLEQNYRSTGFILEAASALIRNNKERHEKTLWTDKAHGHKLLCYQADTESGEARWVVRKALRGHKDGTPLSEVAVFYRTHSQSRSFEDALRAHSVPYKVVGGLKFYERREVKDVLGYLRVVQNPRDEVALMRVINTPTRGIGAKTMERAHAMALERETSLFDGLMLLANQPGGKRSKRSIESFTQTIMRLRSVAANENDVFRVAEAILDETGYLTRLQEEGTIEAETRAENVQELLVSIEEWRTRAEDRSLSAFLDHVALLTSLDEGAPEVDALTLMTVHAAKGLEFDTVFVTGLEEDVFPHFNSKDDEAIEEERRLAYVAITRGRKHVSLTWARSRRRFGRVDMNPPSRFLHEIPDNVRTFESESGARGSSILKNKGLSNAPTWTKAATAATPRALGGVADDNQDAGGWAGAGSQAPARQPAASGWSKPSAPAWASANASSEPTIDLNSDMEPDSQSSRQGGLDYSDSQVPPDEIHGGGSMLGRQVRHPRFGVGTVARVEGQGANAKVMVQFPSFGSKKIVARFLEPVE
ncbi:MAG: DNA helicase-2/ATP-dependent DNA helicase PcrA [Myxococcota bacterium]|jgi:DNA helicase-2/ATP-dependent DNA helicase PcrA